MDWIVLPLKLCPGDPRRRGLLASALLLLAFAALGLQRRHGVVGLAVLGVKQDGGAVGPLADVGRVLKEALLAALHVDDRLAQGGVWDRFKASPQAAFDRVNARVGF